MRQNSMNTTQIRKAGIDDLDAVSALFDQYRQFYEQPSDPVLAAGFIRERFAKGESAILVAEQSMQDRHREGQRAIVGFCQLYPSFCSVIAAPIYILSDLFVAPDYRRTGAGRMLMLAAQEFAAASGAARADLTTARTNARAQALYESLGWKRDEVFLAYNLPTSK